jgi:hypothetical protein
VGRAPPCQRRFLSAPEDLASTTPLPGAPARKGRSECQVVVVGLTPISGGVYWQVTRAVDPGVLTMVFPEQIATDGSALRLRGGGVVDGLSQP